MRIVYILKRDAIPNIVLNKLYKYTSLQSSFSVNNIALVNGRPQMLNLKEMIHYFVEHRHDVVVRRTKYELRKAEERAHILEGLIIASDNIDEVIAIIRGSESPDAARENLIKRFGFLKIARRDFYECGFRPTSQKTIRLPIQFLLICIFFLLYDIELVFLFPFVSAITFIGLTD